MSNPGRGDLALQKLKHALRCGDPTASSNIAALYRELGDFRRAFQWWKRTAGPSDGDAWLEVGYCLQHGIGTKRDVAAGIRAYRQAVRTCYTTEYAREEAQYHLAVALLDRNKVRHHGEVKWLLIRAAGDGDYRQASDLVEQMNTGNPLRICRCRRAAARSRRKGTLQAALRSPTRSGSFTPHSLKIATPPCRESPWGRTGDVQSPALLERSGAVDFVCVAPKIFSGVASRSTDRCRLFVIRRD